MKRISAGILTGLVAGIVMALVMIFVFWFIFGKNLLFPVQVIASAVFGEQALTRLDLPVIGVGLVLHLGVSMFWGAIFGWLSKPLHIESTKKALLAGLVLGAVTMVDVYVFVPWVMNSLHGTDIWNAEVPMFWDWAAHLVYGACFALFPRFLRK